MPRLQSITLIGGEPLICEKQILYFLDKIKKLNIHRKQKIKINVFTNGSFYIDFRKYKSFLEEIVIALAGFGEEHDQIRYYKKNHQGSYKNIITNAHKYMQDGIFIRFNYVVKPRNIINLYTSTKKILRELPPSPISLSIQFDHFTPWGKHLLKVLNYYATILRLNIRYPKHNIYPHHLGQIDKARACTAGASFIGVDLYSGKIHGCHENNGSDRDIIGSLREGIPNTILQNNIKNLSLSYYSYVKTPRLISRWLFIFCGGHICKMRNSYHCQSNTKIPRYFVIIFLLTKLYNNIYKLTRSAQFNK